MAIVERPDLLREKILERATKAEAQLELMPCRHPRAFEAESGGTQVNATPGFPVKYCTVCREIASAERKARLEEGRE